MKRMPWEHMVGLLGLVLVLIGSALGLFASPAEQHMGETTRIMYVHVPSAWASMLVYTLALFFAVASMWTSKARWDAAMTASVEVGAVLNGLLLIQGSIWARPTWGIWWTWDARLTTSAIMMVVFCGILALRSFIEDDSQRATWSAVATIAAWVSVPLVYMSVRWFRTLHQTQSSPDTVDASMVLPLRINAFAFLFLAIWLLARRARLELLRRAHEQVPAPAPITPRGEVEHA
jgi:heme exporter protein C